MAEGIWKVFSSRIMLATATVFRSTSKPATCLRASFAGSRRWAITNLSDSESAARTCPCSSAGKEDRMRSTAFAAEVELRVPRTMWPVSAAVRASETLSLSRSSPITITSGSSRSAARSARAKDWVSLAHLALVDEAALERVHELDRVLHGEDVVVARLVEEVDEGGEGRRLAGARGPAHDHQPLVVLRDLREVRGQPDLGDRGRALRDDAEDAVQPLLVDEHVGAVAAGGRDVVAEVELLLLLQPVPLRVGQDLADHRLGLLGGERLALGADEVGGEPDHRGLARPRGGGRRPRCCGWPPGAR